MFGDNNNIWPISHHLEENAIEKLPTLSLIIKIVEGQM